MNFYQRINHWARLWMSRSYYYLGTTYRHIGNTYALTAAHEKAIDYFSQAVKWDANFARAYLERGILYWRELDHPRRALQDLSLALTIDPTLHAVYFNRGIAHQQLREYAEAITEFQTYLAVGTHPHWREHAANMIRELNEWIQSPDSTAP